MVQKTTFFRFQAVLASKMAPTWVPKTGPKPTQNLTQNQPVAPEGLWQEIANFTSKSVLWEASWELLAGSGRKWPVLLQKCSLGNLLGTPGQDLAGN